MGTESRDPLITGPPFSRRTESIKKSGHFVQLYEDDAVLLERISGWLSTGINAGQASVFIGTALHRNGMEKWLRARGLELDRVRGQGLYVALDAAEILSKFMVGGWPDEARFLSVIGDIIERAATSSPHGDVRAFGEMVALLWAEGKQEAAICIEELFSSITNTRQFCLCCAYPLSSFRASTTETLFLKVCAQHSPPAESYIALTDQYERLRSITLLQLKTQALETEIAEHKEAEKTLHLRDRELSELIENTVERLHQLGPDGTILWANPAQLHLLGYRTDEFIGHHAAEFYIPPERFEELWQKVMLREMVYDFQASLRCKDGTSKRVVIHPVGLWEGERFLTVRCFIRDVSELVKLENELKMRLAQLAEAELRKNEFLAMLGHELNNPLSAVLHSIATAQLDISHREHALDIARRQANQLARLVNDLLEVGRLTQGSISLRKESVFLGSIVEQVVEEVDCLLKSGRRQLTVSISPQAETVQITADPVRLRQVITNLLHNAAQFTPVDGWIKVLVDCKDDKVMLRVSDSGIGIGPETLPRVFDLFMQAEHSVSNVSGGLGIGLTLVKRLVEMHGGSVEARSAGLGKGSEFEVCLPALRHNANSAQLSDPPIQPVARLRVLIVEDNDDAAEALRLLLELFGHEPTVVANGPAAIEAVRTEDYNAALVDIGLPGIDGYEVARQIRRLPTSKTIVLAALTGYGQEADKRQALAAGFNEHLTKPVTIERLQAFLSRIK